MNIIHKLTTKFTDIRYRCKHRRKVITAPQGIKHEYASYSVKYVNVFLLFGLMFNGAINIFFIHLVPSTEWKEFVPWLIWFDLLFGFILVNFIGTEKICYNGWSIAQRQKRLQRYIDKEGVNAIPHILAMFQCGCGLFEAENSLLMDQLVYNLKLLLPKVDEEAILLINHNLRVFLQTLVSQKSHSVGVRIPQIGRLTYYGRLLTSELIPLLGKIGDLDSLDSLTTRFQSSYSPRIHKLIKQSLQDIHPNAVMNKLASRKDDEYQRTVQMLHKSLNHYNRDRKLAVFTFRVIHCGSLTVSLLLLMLIIKNANNVELMSHLILMLTATTVLNLVPKIWERKRQNEVYKLTNDCISKDSPDALVSLLGEGQFLRDNSRISYTLMITELLQNITAENSPVLNSFQIDQVNRLLFPKSLFRFPPRFLNGPMDNIIDLENVILSLKYIGNASSIRALDRLISNPKNECLRKAVENTIGTIKSRMAENPVELLRPSVEHNENLLKTTPETLDSSELLHASSSESHYPSVSPRRFT